VGVVRATVAVFARLASRIMTYHDGSVFIRKPAMAATVREKFSSQATPEVLTALRQIAEADGRQFQAVLDDALREYIDRRRNAQPRRHVVDAFADSLAEFDVLYRELAR
jgi:predicted transcriptional regulator